MMRHKPIHYHVYPDLGDWEYEYSNNTGQGSVVNGQCECGDEIATVRNQMNAHIWDRTVHVTQADRDRWDAGGNGGNVDLSSLSPVAFSGSYNDLSNKPTIPQLDTVNSKISQIETKIAPITQLKQIAYTALYADLIGTPNIPTVDAELDPTSPNTVENRAVYAELNKKATKAQLLEYAKLTDLAGKADITYLADFVTHQYFTNQLANKQNRLQAGEGIQIVNDVISTDLDIDTDVYVIVDELPTVNIESNKIYLKPTEDLENPGNIIYSQYKYDEDEDEWIPLGQIQPTIDLQKYITRQEAAESFAPRYDYATSVQLETLRQNIEDLFQKKGDYITLTYADDTYQPKGNYITSVNLAGYAKLTDLNGLATEQYVQRLLAGITPGTTTNTTIVNNNVEVDIELSATSSNPVENRAIYAELAKKVNTDDLLSYATRSDLQTKADKTQLNNYVRNDAFATALGTKQDVLTEGSGISIDENNEISVTLDTEPFVIVDELPTTNINPNKIYLVQREENGEVYYTEHRRDTQNNTWIDLGVREVNIDLSDYIKETDADRKYLIAPGTYLTPEAAEETYQHIGDYILRSEVQEGYQEKGNYVDNAALSALYATIQNTFLKKSDFGTYLTYGEAVHLFSYIQQVIDSRYVLKTDVRNKMHIQVDSWGTMMPAQMPISGNALPGSGGSGSGSISNMITLSTDEYAALVAADLVDENTYYFTYEKTTWGFGDQFPIILTDGSTPDSIGTFPITLN